MAGEQPRSRDQRQSRSHSPHHSSRLQKKRHRSPSPHSHCRYDDSRRSSATLKIVPPFDARPIFKHDLSRFRPMFGLYLEVQKRRALEELSEEEVRGRWKSFVGKWYDYLTLSCGGLRSSDVLCTD